MLGFLENRPIAMATRENRLAGLTRPPNTGVRRRGWHRPQTQPVSTGSGAGITKPREFVKDATPRGSLDVIAVKLCC
jgi:hypothetical protein